MSTAWVFQANPAHYDIDSALRALDRIWWRTPQHTTDVRAGDVVVLWRSGAEAGVIGVGRVLSGPQLHSMEADEKPYVLDSDESPESTTRTLIAIQAVSLVSKDRVRAIPEMASHRIVTAPMGTVFPLTSEEWQVLSAHLPVPPEPLHVEEGSALPPAFAWEQRAKGVLPMPGGYDGYMQSARRVCEIVGDVRPTSAQLVERMQQEFDLREPASRLRESFLRKIGLFVVESGALQLSAEARRWLETGDDRVVTALLHSRCQFIGEMIHELRTPHTTDEMLSVVNDRYGLSWDSKTQIDNRRGWLQSAGMTSVDDDRRLIATEAGLALIDQLVLQDPAETSSAQSPTQSAPPRPTTSPIVAPDIPLVDALVAEIEASSTDSTHPDRFERAIRDAFSYLGFDAQLLGGAGRTDVLLEAPLSRDESYRVTVDAKTTGSGTLADQQVDWTTLVEHRRRHEADYTLLVGPNPSAGRLMDRARDHDVAVLSARHLAGLCRQHARAPLGLSAYRSLFAKGGEVDTAELDELADDTGRLSHLAGNLCQTLAEKCPTFGRLTARDLWLILANADSGETTTVHEVQGLLDMLGHPLICAVEGGPDEGYMLATDPRVARHRLALLGDDLVAGES